MRGNYSVHGAKSCIKCPAGRIGQNEGATTENDCKLAELGMYNDGKIIDARKCGKGTYQGEEGQLGNLACA